MGWDEEAQIRVAAEVVAAHTLASWERLASLWQQVRYLDRCGIGGALVECGVWRGGCAGMMALAHQAGGAPTRALHLFDSFAGLPPTRDEVDGPAMWAPGDFAADASHLMGLLAQIAYPPGLTAIHPGWFEQTMPLGGVGPIALLRLDGDYYDSTMTCLRHLEPLVVPGGVVIADDYGEFIGCRRAVDEYLGETKQRVLLQHLDYAGRAWVKPH